VAIVAFLDSRNVFHESSSETVGTAAAEQRLIASVVTYAELLTGAMLGHHEAVVRGFFAELISEVVPVDLVVADRAASLRSEARALRLPDALILATADLRADTIIGADDRWSGVELSARFVKLASR